MNKPTDVEHFRDIPEPLPAPVLEARSAILEAIDQCGPLVKPCNYRERNAAITEALVSLWEAAQGDRLPPSITLGQVLSLIEAFREDKAHNLSNDHWAIYDRLREANTAPKVETVQRE